MLIRIDESVVRHISANIDTLTEESPEIKGLNHLATAAREGWHIVIGSLEVLEFLKKCELLEKNSLRLYHWLCSRFVFLASYEDYFCDYVNVRGDLLSLQKHEIGGHNVFEVPVSFFANVYTSLRTSLVSEDLSDCEFYVGLAKKYLIERSGLHNVSLSFDLESGGGMNTYKIFESKIKSEKMVLAIADSDKSYPTDTIGDTLFELMKIYQLYEKSSISEVYSLGVREKENLIPPSMYLLCTNNSSKISLDKLFALENNPKHRDKLLFLDVKDGLKTKKYINDPNVNSYFSEMFVEQSELVSCAIEEIESQDDDFRLIEGIGSKLTEFLDEILHDGLEKKFEQKKMIPDIPPEVIEKIERNIQVKKELYNNLPDNLKSEWDKLCSKIIAWGCSEHLIAM